MDTSYVESKTLEECGTCLFKGHFYDNVARKVRVVLPSINEIFSLRSSNPYDAKPSSKSLGLMAISTCTHASRVYVGRAYELIHKFLMYT